jgi:endonuclease/exonuclease/phosphatase family metal-dependent hydrolase
MHAGEQWYELESFMFGHTQGRVKPIRLADWEELAPAYSTDQPTVLYALVALNAHACQLTLASTSAQTATLQDVRTLPWVDGRHVPFHQAMVMQGEGVVTLAATPPPKRQKQRTLLTGSAAQKQLNKYFTLATPLKKSAATANNTTTIKAKPSVQAGHRRRSEQPQQQARAVTGQELTVATLNVRGIHKAETKLRELICDDKMRADILILTELKSRNLKAQRRWLQSMLPNYKMHLSEATCSGVMVAVCRELLVCGESTTVPTPKGVADNLVHVQIPFPNAALHILGVYSATSTNARKQLYEVCSSKLQSLTDNSVLLAGDFNATLQDRDRVSGKCYNADKLHRQFVASCNLHPTENPANGARAMSYFQGVRQAPCSRIDDILCSQPLTQAQTTTVALAGDLFDHAYVKATLQYDELGISPNPSPSAPLEPKIVLQTPLTKADTAKLSAALTARQPEWTALAVRLSNIIEQEVRPHWSRLQETDASRPAPLSTVEGQPARQLVDQLGEHISTLLLGAHGIAMEVCTTRRTNPSGQHFRPRAVSRRRKRPWFENARR